MELCEAHSTRFAPSAFLATLQAIDPTGWESAKRHRPPEPRILSWELVGP